MKRALFCSASIADWRRFDYSPFPEVKCFASLAVIKHCYLKFYLSWHFFAVLGETATQISFKWNVRYIIVTCYYLYHCNRLLILEIACLCCKVWLAGQVIPVPTTGLFHSPKYSCKRIPDTITETKDFSFKTRIWFNLVWLSHNGEIALFQQQHILRNKY